ncbi:hypothetical protein AWU65_25985 [Paenibacillus glucanolyticus]|uniref:Uncharacterized protein n=1 Tax=Paenibacillus glucanolyticus TaxID=59843 RepID=A0A163E237_9BACL|nr:hypothetical protein AWU65_25985 [Paenibacillus glucanolyticus]
MMIPPKFYSSNLSILAGSNHGRKIYYRGIPFLMKGGSLLFIPPFGIGFRKWMNYLSFIYLHKITTKILYI